MPRAVYACWSLWMTLVPLRSHPSGLQGVRAFSSQAHALIIPDQLRKSSVSSCGTLESRRTPSDCFRCICPRGQPFSLDYSPVTGSKGVFFFTCNSRYRFQRFALSSPNCHPHKNEDLRNLTLFVHIMGNWNHRVAIYIHVWETPQVLLEIRWCVRHKILFRDTLKYRSFLWRLLLHQFIEFRGQGYPCPYLPLSILPTAFYFMTYTLCLESFRASLWFSKHLFFQTSASAVNFKGL